MKSCGYSPTIRRVNRAGGPSSSPGRPARGTERQHREPGPGRPRCGSSWPIPCSIRPRGDPGAGRGPSRGRRAVALPRLFGDLPGPNRSRRTKARFEGVFVRSASRTFIDGWTGDGVPAEVDPEALASPGGPSVSAGPRRCFSGRGSRATRASRAQARPCRPAPPVAGPNELVGRQPARSRSVTGSFSRRRKPPTPVSRSTRSGSESSRIATLAQAEEHEAAKGNQAGPEEGEAHAVAAGGPPSASRAAAASTRRSMQRTPARQTSVHHERVVAENGMPAKVKRARQRALAGFGAAGNAQAPSPSTTAAECSDWRPCQGANTAAVKPRPGWKIASSSREGATKVARRHRGRIRSGGSRGDASRSFPRQGRSVPRPKSPAEGRCHRRPVRGSRIEEVRAPQLLEPEPVRPQRDSRPRGVVAYFA